MQDLFDLVVVGYGAAGVAAATTAAAAGASVALIEKQPRDQHLSGTRLSGGLIMGANSVERATVYLDACSGEMIPHEVSRAWAERGVELQSFLRGIGIETVRTAGGWFPALDGYEAIDVFSPIAKGVDPLSIEVEEQTPGELVFTKPVQFGQGDMLHDQLVGAVEARRSHITVFFEHRAERLSQRDGRIVGVSCSTSASNPVTFESRLGVVLASGGYEQDQEMILNYLKAYPIYFYGSRAATGDGIRIAQQVGADLWHMNQMIGRGVGHFEHPDGTEYTFNLSINPPGYVILDRYGNRFVNEYLQAVSKPNFYYELLTYDADRLEYPRIPSYWLFDRRRFEATGLTRSKGYYEWSTDNRAELELGWIFEGSTVEEVAAAAGISDPANAARSVSDYNATCASDGTDAWGRPRSSLIPLDQPPFYCVRLYPGGATTNGGPRRDQHARVLNSFGEPIPGLFGAGELGGTIGLLYPAPGANLGEAFAFGEISAKTAVNDV